MAALVLTKLNLGVFAVAAVVLSAVLVAEPLQRRRWIRYPVIAAFVALPLALTARDLGLVGPQPDGAGGAGDGGDRDRRLAAAAA